MSSEHFLAELLTAVFVHVDEDPRIPNNFHTILLPRSDLTNLALFLTRNDNRLKGSI